jgi:hypothetical protein
LSTVAGIVKHHHGFMDIQTKAGGGTEFHVYFPAHGPVKIEDAKSTPAVPPIGNGELILLIDDEETLLELTKTMLENFGYKVITAQNGLQGITRFKDYQDEVKLLITDSDMPYMDGMGVIHAIKDLKPDIPMIIASGTKHNTAELRKTDCLHLKSLGKPYRLDQLLIAVNTGLRH